MSEDGRLARSTAEGLARAAGCTPLCRAADVQVEGEAVAVRPYGVIRRLAPVVEHHPDCPRGPVAS